MLAAVVVVVVAVVAVTTNVPVNSDAATARTLVNLSDRSRYNLEISTENTAAAALVKHQPASQLTADTLACLSMRTSNELHINHRYSSTATAIAFSGSSSENDQPTAVATSSLH